ncbi:MAG TPA: hypothetical protein VLA88_00620 [Candidatus Saccharimonadales bacterium]|nr:hypothetical protein [Candidatus Saccharimonadales bacterium]
MPTHIMYHFGTARQRVVCRLYEGVVMPGNEPTAGAAFRRIIRDRAVNPAADRTEAHAAGAALDELFEKHPNTSVQVVHPELGVYCITIAGKKYNLPPLRGCLPITVQRDRIWDGEHPLWHLPASVEVAARAHDEESGGHTGG